MSPRAEAVALVTLEKRGWRGIESQLLLPMGATELEPGSSGGAPGKGKRPQTQAAARKLPAKPEATSFPPLAFTES